MPQEQQELLNHVLTQLDDLRIELSIALDSVRKISDEGYAYRTGALETIIHHLAIPRLLQIYSTAQAELHNAPPSEDDEDTGKFIGHFPKADENPMYDEHKRLVTRMSAR